MPKNYGVKEKEQVISYITERLLKGDLRTGDRLDRNEIAATLGLSRVPVSEAIIQLEHDGIVSTRYHRGAFVERFDPAAVLEHHEIYGLLSGVASARAATYPTPRILAELAALIDSMRSVSDSRDFQKAVAGYRRTINYEYAGPRLQAAIRASQSFVPHAFWVSCDENRAMILPCYEAEHAAIRQRDPEGARAACQERALLTARVVVTELVRRGVFESADGVEPLEFADATFPLTPMTGP